MAEIFLALQIGAEGFEKPVVLKRILPALGSDPAFVRMLVDEAHIVSTLNHTHLVQILDLGNADGQFFLVLEFVDGWSLEQVRRRARKAKLKMPLPIALYITSALCRGLEYVHRRTRNGKPLGIVHRDVTPQNVLLGREGDVKLADFGIAKAIGRREKSATGVIKGKFAYMSPEQTIGAELDARSDLFSVGTLLYLLTTGQKPFDAPTDLDVLMQVRKARHEKPSALVRDFDPDVERFIERALRADRARRWQSAEQMADRLDTILAGLGKPAGPAALKRWLDTLSARDGIRPPGDLVEAPPEPISGTMQLASGDLELHHVSPPRPGEEDDEELATLWSTTRKHAQQGAVNEPIPTVARADGGVSDEPRAHVLAAAALASERLRSAADDPTTFRELTSARGSAPEIALQGGREAKGNPHVGEGAVDDFEHTMNVDPASDLLDEREDERESVPDEERSDDEARAALECDADEELGADDDAQDERMLDEDDDEADDDEGDASHLGNDVRVMRERAIGTAPERGRPRAAARAYDDDDDPADGQHEVMQQFHARDEEEPALDFAVDVEDTTAQRRPADGGSLESGTAPLLLSNEPRTKPRSRGLGWLSRVAIVLLVLPPMVGAGAYVARPYLPPWMVPERLVELVDGWITRLPRSLDLGGARSDTQPSATHAACPQ